MEPFRLAAGRKKKPRMYIRGCMISRKRSRRVRSPRRGFPADDPGLVAEDQRVQGGGGIPDDAGAAKGALVFGRLRIVDDDHVLCVLARLAGLVGDVLA